MTTKKTALDPKRKVIRLRKFTVESVEEVEFVEAEWLRLTVTLALPPTGSLFKISPFSLLSQHFFI